MSNPRKPSPPATAQQPADGRRRANGSTSPKPGATSHRADTAEAPGTVTAKDLKVRTGEILGMVAEGAVVYVTRRGKTVARIEPARLERDAAEIARLDALNEELYGKYRGILPSSAEYTRSKHLEERTRDRNRRRGQG